MKQEQKTLHQRFGLTVLFSAIVFLILLITSLLIFIVGVLLIRINAINIAKLSRQEPMLPIFMLLIISVVVGTVVSFMISRFPLKPLRRVIDAPRPYDDPAFAPLLEKETKGQALPSRHALSAAVITAVWWRYSVPAGVLMAAVTAAVCATRVLAGVHTVRDVAAGAALGFGMGLALLLR